VRWIDDKSFPRFDAKKLIAFFGISVDVSEQKETQLTLENALRQAKVAEKTRETVIHNLHMIGLPHFVVSIQSMN